MYELYIGCKPVEYFCYSCGQLRLSVDGKPDCCGHCKSKDIITGKPNTLDKEKLKADYANKQDKPKQV